MQVGRMVVGLRGVAVGVGRMVVGLRGVAVGVGRIVVGLRGAAVGVDSDLADRIRRNGSLRHSTLDDWDRVAVSVVSGIRAGTYVGHCSPIESSRRQRSRLPMRR
ncbi:MAG: hypothetical protein ACK5KU_11910, partial [Beutenbergiaceae bacterium]